MRSDPPRPSAPSPPGGVVRLATRGSPLALHQAALVAELLEKARPGWRVETVVVRTRGDRDADAPLAQVGGQGVFAKEIQEAVLEGRADVAVHSAKDLPSTTPEGLVIAAVPPRADPRDALVGGKLDDLPAGAKVATGSARRRSQLANLRPDLLFGEARGNMATRLALAGSPGVSVVVVAMAALERLGWTERADEVLGPEVMVPQAGQGSLALECRAGDTPTADALGAVDDPSSHRALLAERAFLAAVGGSCTIPVAAWAREDGGGQILLDGMLASGDGRLLVRSRRRGGEPTALGTALAAEVLACCGGGVLEGWEPTAAPGRAGGGRQGPPGGER